GRPARPGRGPGHAGPPARRRQDADAAGRRARRRSGRAGRGPGRAVRGRRAGQGRPDRRREDGRRRGRGRGDRLGPAALVGARHRGRGQVGRALGHRALPGPHRRVAAGDRRRAGRPGLLRAGLLTVGGGPRNPRAVARVHWWVVDRPRPASPADGGGPHRLHGPAGPARPVGSGWLVAPDGSWLRMARGSGWLVAPDGSWPRMARGPGWLVAPDGSWPRMARGPGWLVAPDGSSPRTTRGSGRLRGRHAGEAGHDGGAAMRAGPG